MFFLSLYKTISWKIEGLISRFTWWLAENTPLHKKEPCKCKGYYPFHPKASQVKEKFGGLRFYYDPTEIEITDQIFDLVTRAETESYKICEECGKPGKLRNKGWYVTLCNKCYKEKYK